MILPEYLIENKVRIINVGNQNLDPWGSGYDSSLFNKFPVMEELKEKFPNKKITRSNINNLFEKNNIYLGFVASMVWGGISSTRPKIKGDKTTTDLYKVLSYPEDLIKKSIYDTNIQLEKGNIEIPFNNFMPKGKYKIPGVGYSFFTKIFFFLGQANTSIKIKPLIFDKWTKNAFYALLVETHPAEINDYFLGINENTEVNIRSGKKLTVAYIRYVELMNNWSKEINIAPDKLEKFLFGYSRKDKNITNPRLELWDIIQNFKGVI